MPDRVILRRWCFGSKSVIALFPDMPGFNGRVNAYEHIGQHGDADYEEVMSLTTPVRVDDPEAAALLAELRTIGYEPVVKQRASRRHHDGRQS